MSSILLCHWASGRLPATPEVLQLGPNAHSDLSGQGQLLTHHLGIFISCIEWSFKQVRYHKSTRLAVTFLKLKEQITSTHTHWFFPLGTRPPSRFCQIGFVLDNILKAEFNPHGTQETGGVIVMFALASLSCLKCKIYKVVAARAPSFPLLLSTVIYVHLQQTWIDWAASSSWLFWLGHGLRCTCIEPCATPRSPRRLPWWLRITLTASTRTVTSMR